MENSTAHVLRVDIYILRSSVWRQITGQGNDAVINITHHRHKLHEPKHENVMTLPHCYGLNFNDFKVSLEGTLFLTILDL